VGVIQKIGCHILLVHPTKTQKHRHSVSGNSRPRPQLHVWGVCGFVIRSTSAHMKENSTTSCEDIQAYRRFPPTQPRLLSSA
jgi:hypothetical protein